jgi:hypothetical protein
MTCRRFQIGNVSGFICSRGEDKQYCSDCGKVATRRCDFPLIGKDGRFCGKNLCDSCVQEIEVERLPDKFLKMVDQEDSKMIDVCPVHRRFIESLQYLIERLYDQNGVLLLEEPYVFSRLFGEGQLMIINSVKMTVISCEKIGSVIETRVKLHDPWKGEG